MAAQHTKRHRAINHPHKPELQHHDLLAGIGVAVLVELFEGEEHGGGQEHQEQPAAQAGQADPH